MSDEAVLIVAPVAPRDPLRVVDEKLATLAVLEQQVVMLRDVPAEPMVVRDDAAPTVVQSDAPAAPGVVVAGFAGPRGPQGPQGQPGPAGSATFEVIAGANLTYPVIVAVVDGVAHVADPASTTDMTSQLAVTTQAAAPGQPVVLATRFTHTESAWAWPTGRVYLADAPGQLSPTPAAAAVLEVARVVSPNTLDFDIQTALLRA